MSRAIISSITVCALALAPSFARAQEPAAAPPTATAPATADPPAPGWDDEPAATSPPPPRVTPETAAAPPADAPPSKPKASGPGKGLFIGGMALIGVGATSLLFIAGPAAIAKRVAMNNAENDAGLDTTSQRDHYNSARIADNTMEGAFWVGISALVLGTALAIAGGVMKSRARSRSMARLRGGGGGISLRF